MNLKHFRPGIDASEFLSLVFVECTTFVFEVLLIHKQYSLNKADYNASEVLRTFPCGVPCTLYELVNTSLI
jgi:hypothetical protein